MKKATPLRIFSFTHSLVETEFPCLLGDKFVHALSIPWEMTSSISEANVIAWDGIITPKNNSYVQKIKTLLEEGRILLLLPNQWTIFNASSPVKIFDTREVQGIVELNGAGPVPEEILMGLKTCYEKINHV